MLGMEICVDFREKKPSHCSSNTTGVLADLDYFSCLMIFYHCTYFSIC